MNTRIWERWGSEDECADRMSGNPVPTAEELPVLLAAHHEADISELGSDEEREEAVEALVRGYTRRASVVSTVRQSRRVTRRRATT